MLTFSLEFFSNFLCLYIPCTVNYSYLVATPMSRFEYKPNQANLSLLPLCAIFLFHWIALLSLPPAASLNEIYTKVNKKKSLHRNGSSIQPIHTVLQTLVAIETATSA